MKLVLIRFYFQYQVFHLTKLLNAINALVNLVQIWPKLISIVTMATEDDIEIWTMIFLLLSGNDHCVKVSSNYEMVRGTALWKTFGVLRELMLKFIYVFACSLVADKANFISELSKWKQSKSVLKVMTLVMPWLRDLWYISFKTKTYCHFCLIVQASLI